MQSFIDANCALILQAQDLEKETNQLKRQLHESTNHTHEEEQGEERDQCLDVEKKEDEEEESKEKNKPGIKEMKEINDDREAQIANNVEESNKCLQTLQQENFHKEEQRKKEKENRKSQGARRKTTEEVLFC